MGMYTGFRVRGRIKPEYVEAIAYALHLAEYEWKAAENHWCRAALEFPILAALPNYLPFAIKERADCIPGMYSEVGDWNRDDPGWQTSFVDEYLVLQSVIKNYDDEFDALRKLIPSLFDTVDHCEELYEEYDIGALYVLENGEMIMKARQAELCEFDHFGTLGHENAREPEKRWESPWMISQKTQPNIIES